jgi:nitrite reductase/ring-hydroxylating ferredoxin subunit
MAEADGGVPMIGCAARRAVLAGLASAGAVALAGCGTSGTPSTPTAGGYNTNDTPTPQQSGNGQPTESGAGGGTGTGQSPATGAKPSSKPPAAGGGTAAGLVKTDKVPVGGGVRAGNLMVVQPQQGVFRAFETTCPHAGVAVGVPAGGVITCPAHDSKFKVNDGARISGPAARGLKQVAVKVQNGVVVRA